MTEADTCVSFIYLRANMELGMSDSGMTDNFFLDVFFFFQNVKLTDIFLAADEAVTWWCL